MLMNIDKMYPGMKKYIQLGAISAQGQTGHDLRTATDQRGEQTKSCENIRQVSQIHKVPLKGTGYVQSTGMPFLFTTDLSIVFTGETSVNNFKT